MATETAESFDTVGAIVTYESGEATIEEALELFGHLIRTGQAWTLQGSYGRTAQAMIDSDLIDAETGDLTQRAIDRLDQIED